MLARNPEFYNANRVPRWRSGPEARAPLKAIQAPRPHLFSYTTFPPTTVSRTFVSFTSSGGHVG
jgi:hypothetical protein